GTRTSRDRPLRHHPPGRSAGDLSGVVEVLVAMQDDQAVPVSGRTEDQVQGWYGAHGPRVYAQMWSRRLVWLPIGNPRPPATPPTPQRRTSSFWSDLSRSALA